MSWKGKSKQLTLPCNKVLPRTVKVSPEPSFSLKGSLSDRRAIKPVLQYNWGMNSSSMEMFRQHEGLAQRDGRALWNKTGQKKQGWMQSLQLLYHSSTLNRDNLSKWNQLVHVNTKERPPTKLAQQVHLSGVLLSPRMPDTSIAGCTSQASPQILVPIQS